MQSDNSTEPHDAFGVLDWKILIFFERAVPITPNTWQVRAPLRWPARRHPALRPRAPGGRYRDNLRGGGPHLHYRFRKRGADYLRNSGMKWMNGITKRRCDRTLGRRQHVLLLTGRGAARGELWSEDFPALRSLFSFSDSLSKAKWRAE